MSTGTYYHCDSCGKYIYGDIPFGWIGLTRVTDEAEQIPEGQENAGKVAVRVQDQHACGDACAQRLLMTTIVPATRILQ